MSEMITELLAAAERFDSPSVPGLLRSAPDLEPLVGYINSLYYIPESGMLTPLLIGSALMVHRKDGRNPTK
jgi:hypothetical protein